MENVTTSTEIKNNEQNIKDEKLFRFPLLTGQVALNIDHLNYRYNRLKSINVTDHSNNEEFLMVFDAFLVLFRAVFLENGNTQYTIQHYYRAKGDDDTADKINAFLDRPVYEWSDLSIRKMLKFIADKFVCHADPISTEDLGVANVYMAHLMNPYEKNNLQTILEGLNKILESSKRVIA